MCIQTRVYGYTYVWIHVCVDTRVYGYTCVWISNLTCLDILTRVSGYPHTLHILLPSRRHRKGFIKLKAEALRLLRTSSSKATCKENIAQFKHRLRDRGYPDSLLENTLSGIKFSKRMSALQKKQKTGKRILPFVTEYRLSVPNLKALF